MKAFAALCICFVVTSCESKESVQSDLDKLRNERRECYLDINLLNSDIEWKKKELASINSQLDERKIYLDGKTPKYILKLKLKQSHFSVNPMKHAKDAMNAITFELPVDRDFYNSVSKGTEIVDEFRAGSFIMNGSFGDWKMTVQEKEIRK